MAGCMWLRRAVNGSSRTLSSPDGLRCRTRTRTSRPERYGRSTGRRAGRRREESMRYVSCIHREHGGSGVSSRTSRVASVADTVDDAVRRGSEALAFHVEGLADDGETIRSQARSRPSSRPGSRRLADGSRLRADTAPRGSRNPRGASISPWIRDSSRPSTTRPGKDG